MPGYYGEPKGTIHVTPQDPDYIDLARKLYEDLVARGYKAKLDQ